MGKLTSLSTKSGARIRLLTMLFVAAALPVALHNTNLQVADLWQRTALNSSHVAVFALVGLVLLAAAAHLKHLSYWQKFLVALLAALAVGTTSEAAQINTLRDASIEDLLSNWRGATGALLMRTAFRRGQNTKKGSPAVLAVAGSLVLTAALFPLLKVTAAYIERDADKASIASFDDFFFRTFALPQNASLSVVEFDGRKIGRVHLRYGSSPGIVFHDVWPNWWAYSDLVVEISLPDANPLTVHVRVHDRAHRVGEQPYRDQFNTHYVLVPGANTVRIPLETIRNAPQGRLMDLSQIDGIVVFCAAKDAGRRFDVLGIRLE